MQTAWPPLPPDATHADRLKRVATVPFVPRPEPEQEPAEQSEGDRVSPGFPKEKP